MAKFYEEFVQLCNMIEKKPTTVAKELGLKGAHVNRWKNGSMPTDATKFKICDYFGLPHNYFGNIYALPSLGEISDKNEKPTETNLDGLLPGYEGLTDENKAKAREYVEMLLKLQRTE